MDDIVSYVIGKKKGGVTPTGEIDITQNGVTNVSGYATANVQVPEPSGTINITQNGETNVKNYETANVNVPQPSGKITITQNGTDIDVSSYASADVNVGGSVINSINTLNNAYKNAIDSFFNVVNSTIPNRTAYTNNSITLYTPDTNFKRYAIIKTNDNKYRVHWFQQLAGNYFWRIMYLGAYTGSASYNNMGGTSFQYSKDENGNYYCTSYFSNTLNQATNRISYYYSQYYDTLEEAVNAITSNSTIYTKYTSTYLYDAKIAIYSNEIFFDEVDNDVVIIDMGILSHNETIEVISSE